MYKYLLCGKYLTTRWIGLVSVISVMLGVGTMIVVNSVMFGFRTKMQQRLHGILADVIVGAPDLNGFGDYEAVMKQIKETCGDRIDSMTVVMEVWGLIKFDINGYGRAQPVTVVGIEPEGRSQVGEFRQHLMNPENQKAPSFVLREDAQKWREQNPGLIQAKDELLQSTPAPAFIGYQVANLRDPKGREIAVLPPGSEFVLSTVATGRKSEPVHQRFVVADWFRCDMSEYDANWIFVPLKELQQLRLADNRVTSIQIKLKDFASAPEVVEKIRGLYSPFLDVQTWEDKQSVLLRAVKVEAWLLNFILFFIIAVAGFGILAVFFMIVVEKTKDIGVLKALGASDRGVMGVFIGYGLVLGLIGCGLGASLGVWFTLYINPIERWLTHWTGVEIFPRDVYYFKEIPAILDEWTLLFVNVGALFIAVSASVLPAMRAARLRPVEALRYA